jgi:hypothetical protein
MFIGRISIIITIVFSFITLYFTHIEFKEGTKSLKEFKKMTYYVLGVIVLSTITMLNTLK